MRSPVRGLPPSDGEKVSDNTPLLQDAPQAEVGEERRDPGALAGWRGDEYRRPWPIEPELLRPVGGRAESGVGEGEPRRVGTRGKRAP